MTTIKVNVDFEDNTLTPILTFIENTRKGIYTEGQEVVTISDTRIQESCYTENIPDIPLIYGVSD